MWAKELYGFADHTPETEEYGITSHVYRARRPFVPEAILALLDSDLPGVIRAKGHFWIATRPDWVAEFSLAGALSGVTPLGTWWASVPRERWPSHDSRGLISPSIGMSLGATAAKRSCLSGRASTGRRSRRGLMPACCPMGWMARICPTHFHFGAGRRPRHEARRQSGGDTATPQVAAR